ncbi:MAG: hypothetical protein GY820_14590 [Gammaproteobacteria bacterium]|nr:hypothetical protein [Gammaproteobacteria bacterium]
MNITLTHASDASKLHSAGDVSSYFVEVTSCELIVRRYTLEVGLAQEVSRRLNSGEGIMYNLNRLVVGGGPCEIAQGVSSYRANVCTGRLPSLCIAYFLDGDAFTNRKKTIFGFKNKNVKRLAFECEGRSYPQYDFSHTDFSVTDPGVEKRGALSFFNRSVKSAVNPWIRH